MDVFRNSFLFRLSESYCSSRYSNRKTKEPQNAIRVFCHSNIIVSLDLQLEFCSTEMTAFRIVSNCVTSSHTDLKQKRESSHPNSFFELLPIVGQVDFVFAF